MSVATAVFHPGFGERLRQARTALGLTPAEVAAKLKLGSRQIEALEAEDLAQLPGDVFTRGFVRNYARLVKIDPEQLIVPIDINATIAETITAPSEGVSFASPGLRRWVLLPLLALSFFVLMVALLYYWLRQGEDALVAAPADPASAQVAPAETITPVPPAAITPEPLAPADSLPSAPVGMTSLDAPPATASQPPVAAPLPTPAAVPTPAPTPIAPPRTGQPAATVTPAAAVSAPAVARPAAAAVAASVVPRPVPAAVTTPGVARPAAAAVATPAVTAPVAPVAGNGHTLRFTPGLDAWIQVVDGKGKRYSRLVPAGSAEVFSGEPPFRLVVGEAAQVKLTYDGHSIDLAPYIGQKVARLTLE